jgi:hypothetical protein
MSLKLHGHPQLLTYPDQTQWIKPSFQGHFGRGADGNNPITSGHVHVEPLFPCYAEIGAGSIEVPFTLQLHHFHGQIRGFFGEHIQKVVWEQTGTTTMPAMVGDPEGDLLWNGVATYDITRASNGDDRFVAKAPGWGYSRFSARAYFGEVPNDNWRADVAGWVPFYSIINPQLPEVPSQPGGSRGILSTRVDYSSPISGPSGFGTLVNEIQDFMPVQPISAPWLSKYNGYNYTGSLPTTGAFEQRRDVDFHHGNPGITEALVLADRQGVARTITLDPLALGNGLHKEAFIWRQTAGNADPAQIEHVWSLLTFPVTAGASTPPMPELCNDHTAINFGQPLPCVYTPPADPFVAFSPTWKHVPGTNRVQILNPDGTVIGELTLR